MPEDIWEGDLLDRKSEAVYLQRYLENVYANTNKSKDSSFVLNINSEWGHGKTWFLKRLAKELNTNYPVVYFDAWKNDFTKDALLSFVSVICTELDKQFRTGTKISNKIKAVKNTFSFYTAKAIPIIASVAVKQLTGMSLDKIFDAPLEKDDSKSIIDATGELAKIASNSVVESFTQAKSAIDQFKNAIEALVKEIDNSKNIQLPIFIFVDELDRCRPTYAIELLESIKHLFGTQGIFFVIATDTKQLSHSIKAVYGNDFSSLAYLKRFFYAEYKLAEPNYANMANFLFEDLSLCKKLFMPEPLLTEYGFEGFFSKTAEFFRLTTRDQEQVFNILKTILLTSEYEEIHYIFILLLICIRHKFDDYSEEMNDKQSQLIDILTKSNLSGKIKNLPIMSLYWNSNKGGEIREHTMLEIFRFYLTLLYENINSIQMPSRSSNQFEYHTNTVTHLLRKTTRDRHGNRLGSNELLSSFELLSQAGRIAINK